MFSVARRPPPEPQRPSMEVMAGPRASQGYPGSDASSMVGDGPPIRGAELSQETAHNALHLKRR